jgi:hypothetical protein
VRRPDPTTQKRRIEIIAGLGGASRPTQEEDRGKKVRCNPDWVQLMNLKQDEKVR